MAFGLVAASSAYAATISRDGAACRAASRDTAPVRAYLRRGERVTLLSARGAWSHVDPARRPACWVRSDALASSSAVAPRATVAARGQTAARGGRTYRRPVLLAAPRVHSSRRRSSSSAARRSRPRAFYEGGGCPCSGSHICIGPRGGRYCITSGGNKRYGL